MAASSSSTSSSSDYNPRAIFEWQDSESTGAVGWVVLDEVINGVAGGGIFMHGAATQEETADIARNMSRKFTVTDPQIGGAKAGIRFDHRDSRAKEVLQRFIIANGHLLKNAWVTAGDLNTDDNFIEHVIQNDLGLPTCQATLGRRFGEVTGQPDLSTSLARIIAHPANDFFPLIEGAVGYGLTASIAEAWKLSGKSGIPNVAIQGFGAVGSSAAFYLEELGLGKVVAISDAFGFISCQEGLPIRSLLERRKAYIQGLVSACASPQVIEQAHKNLYLDDEDKAKFHFRANTFDSPKAYLHAFFGCGVKADVFSPCAVRYVLTEESVDVLLETMNPTFVVSGANNPYGKVNDNGSVTEDKEGKVLALLEHRGVCVVPDWVANSGTAQLFHRGLSVPFDMDYEGVAHQILEACAHPIRTYLNVAFLRFARKNPLLLAKACDQLATLRLKHPRSFLASVGRGYDPSQIGSNPAGSRYALPPPTHLLSIEHRVERLDHLLTHYGAECIQREEMLRLFNACPNPVAYDGFEPSGRMHIAQGLMKKNFVNALTDMGYTFIFWVADWFAFLNHKMGGDLEKIKVVGRYMIEVWKASGMNMDRVRFLWASEEFSKHGDEYWALVLDIATKNSVNRITRCTQIMGRGDKGLSSSQIIYPCMQAADIFFLGVDTCQLGLDQRKINMLAREYADSVGLPKPSILSHPMVPGLKRGQEKMSKSMPDTAIFMEDPADEVARKIKGAFCPGPDDFLKLVQEKLAKISSNSSSTSSATEAYTNSEQDRIEAENLANPVLAYFRLIVADSVPEPMIVGDQSFATFADLREAYLDGRIDPISLKTSLTHYINLLLEPVRQHFEHDIHARQLRDDVLSFNVSR